MEITEIEDLENMEQSLTIWGDVFTLSVRTEDLIRNQQFVSKEIYIGNKKIGHIEVADNRWNVIEEKRSAIVPFTELMDAIIYILKEEGYL